MREGVGRKESWPDFMVSRQVGELPETNRPTFTPTHVLLSFSPLTIPGPRIFDRYSCTAIPSSSLLPPNRVHDYDPLNFQGG